MEFEKKDLDRKNELIEYVREAFKFQKILYSI